MVNVMIFFSITITVFSELYFYFFARYNDKSQSFNAF